MRVEQRGEREGLRRLDGAQPRAIRRLDDALRRSSTTLIVSVGSEARDRRAMRATRRDRALDERRASAKGRAASWMRTSSGGSVGQRLEAATDRFLARRATGNGRAELARPRSGEPGSASCEARPVVRVDDRQDGSRRSAMVEQRLQRMCDDRLARQQLCIASGSRRRPASRGRRRRRSAATDIDDPRTRDALGQLICGLRAIAAIARACRAGAELAIS